METTGSSLSRRAWLVLALAAGSVAAGPPARAQAGGLEEARRFVTAGKLTEAEAVYDRLLAEDPSSAEARLGRGYARAFRGEFERAQADFRRLLSADAGNVGALSGLGYALAWSGAYDDAERQFRAALEHAPGQPDAVKGLAYVALWRGDPKAAAQRFEAIAREQPGNAEAHVGLGQSLLAGGRRNEAGQAFTRALEIDPGRRDALLGLEGSRPRGVRVDATALGGLTAFGGSTKAGFRFAEIAVSPAENARFWIQFDDSLSLDAPGLARRDAHAPSYYVGGQATWSERYTGRLEGGWRKLADGDLQPLLRSELVVATDGGVAFKAGGWIGPHPGAGPEASAHAAVEIPLGDRLTLETAVFYGRSGLAGEHELRGLLGATGRLRSGFELGAGIAAGHAFSPIQEFDGGVASAYGRASAPLGGTLRAQLLVKHERPQAGPTATTCVLGLSASFGGRP